MAFNQFVTIRNGVKTIISIPWTVDQLQYGQNKSEKVKSEDDAFAKVPLVFRAVNVRCNTLSRVPYKLFNLNDKEVEAYPYEQQLPFQELLWKCEAALLLRGATFVVRLADAGGTEIGLQWLNPFTMRVKPIRDTTRIGFQQYVNGNTYPKNEPYYWTEDEMFYLRQFSASDDIGFGTAAASVSLGSARLQHYLTFFASQFFENGAMPVTMLSLPENTQTAERERTENFFRKAIQGVRNAFKVFAFSGDIKAEILTPKFSELNIPGLKEHAIDDVAWAFDIPKTILTADSANYATAEQEMESFLKNTIVPRCTFFAHQFNTKLLIDYGMKIKFFPQELPEMQEDEAKRSVAFRNYVLSGMRPQIAGAVLGIDIPEEYQEEWKQKPTPIEKRGFIEPQTNIPATEQSDSGEGQKMVLDLSRWQKKSLKRVAEGKPAQVEFQSDFIPMEIKAGVTALLAEAKSDAEVKHIFTETIQEFCPAKKVEVKTSERSDGQVLRSIESLSLRVGELAEKVKPHITVQPADVRVNVMPQVDVTGIKSEIADLIINFKTALENTAKQSEQGAESWRAEFRMLQEQYHTKIAAMTEVQRSAFETVFTKTVGELEKNIDRVIENQKTLSAEEKAEALKTTQAPQEVFDRFDAKLEAIFTAVTRPKTTTVKRDAQGNIKELRQS